jgi:hypothetical protein
MPILRNGCFSDGGSSEMTMAWVSVPDLGVRADGQRYSFVRAIQHEHVIRYEATDCSFAADITLDHDGIVIDYPGIARRLPERPPNHR